MTTVQDLIDPVALGPAALVDWCARERVSHAGMIALRHAGQLSTTYRWDHARRGTVASRLGSPDLFFEHDWLERALEERDAERAAAAARREAALAVQREAAAAELRRRAQAPEAPRPAPPPAPLAQRTPSVKKGSAAQMGLFERTGT